MKKVGIIIPYYNLIWMTRNCLDSIKASGGNYQIYLIDNGSEERIDFSNDFHLIRLDKNYGFVKAANLGIKKVLNDGLDYFILLNNDTLVTSGWLERMYQSIVKKNTYIVGPMSSPPNWRELEQAKMIIRNKIPYKMIRNSIEEFGKQVRLFKEKEKRVKFLPFFCAMFRSDIIKKLGYLNEDYGLGLFDDNDYCYKATKIGLRLILRRDVYVHHYHRSTWIENKIDYSSILEKNRKKFIKLNGFDPWIK